MSGQSSGSLGLLVVLGAVVALLAGLAVALWPYVDRVLRGLEQVGR